MARVMVMAMPFTGHVAPMLSVAREALARGHDVRFYTGSAFRRRIEQAGARFVPWLEAPDFDESDIEASFPRLKGRRNLRQIIHNIEDLFIHSAIGQSADLRAEWSRYPWDVLVGEESSIAPAFVAEATATPWATVGILPAVMPSRRLPPSGLGLQPGRGALGAARDATLRAVVRPLLMRPLGRAVASARAAVGLPPGETSYDTATLSPALIAATGCARLDFARPDPPAQLRYVGDLATPPGRTTGATAPTTPKPFPDWWPDVAGGKRRVVHVTQGTQNVDPTDLIRPSLEALAERDVIVVVATGVPGRTELPFAVPANARVTDFVPYGQLLPHVDAMVTNGGWGGTLAALSHGIPLVVAGGDIDKPEIAARVAWSGAGINLKTGTPTARRVGEAVDRLRTEPSFAAAARGLADDLASLGGVTRTLDLIEALLA